MPDISLAAFRQFQQAASAPNAIANLSQNGSVQQAGIYKGPLGAIFRSDTEKTNNNLVRTQLLKALGTALNISEGISEANGRVTFSSEFMAKLEQMIGVDVFKRGDFGVAGANGEVTSGKPLTERRISAILQRVETIAAQNAPAEVAEPEPEPPLPEVSPQHAQALDEIGSYLNALASNGEHLKLGLARDTCRQAADFFAQDVRGAAHLLFSMNKLGQENIERNQQAFDLLQSFVNNAILAMQTARANGTVSDLLLRVDVQADKADLSDIFAKFIQDAGRATGAELPPAPAA